MFETFKAIKDDPRSSTGVFCALKRHTSYDTGEYSAYTFHDFGVCVEAEFTTVCEDAVGGKIFEMYANNNDGLVYHPLWDGLYYLEEIKSGEPWEVPAQDIYEPRLDTGSFILSQTNAGVKVWRPIEQDKEKDNLHRLCSLGGTIYVYSEYQFCEWLLRISHNARDVIRNAPREICEETSYQPRHLKIMVPDQREAMFGLRGKGGEFWIDNIKRIG